MEDIFESLRTTPFDINDHNPKSKWFNFSCRHTEESKKLISESKMGIKQTQEHIQKRVEKIKGFKQSEHQKNRAKETLSDTWSVTSPQNQTFNITNLREFCRNNGLDQGNMVKVSTGILKQHKGWKCFKIVS